MYDARTCQDLTVCGVHIARTMSCVREHKDLSTVGYLQPLNAVTVKACEVHSGDKLYTVVDTFSNLLWAFRSFRGFRSQEASRAVGAHD